MVICTIGRVPAGDGHTLIYTIGRVANFIALYIHIFVGRVPMGDGHTQVHRPGSFGRWPYNNNNNNNNNIFIIIQESINIYLNPALVTQAAARVRPEDQMEDTWGGMPVVGRPNR